MLGFLRLHSSGSAYSRCTKIERVAVSAAVFATVFVSYTLQAQEVVTLDITAFGATPDSGQDAGPAVKAAITKARDIEKPVTIRFPKGRYDFFKASATKVHHPVTAVHQQWDHVTPFYLTDLRDITIDGGGSFFMMHGRMTPVILYRCERVKLVDFAIDQEFPTVQEAMVAAVGDGVVDLRVHPDTRYELGGDGKPVWLDADGRRSEQPNVWNQYDPVSNTFRGGGNPFAKATRVEEIQPSLLRCHLRDTRGYQKGASLQWRWHIRNQQGSIILESRDVVLDRVKLHTTNGLGILAQLSHNLTLENVQVEPRKESERTAASFADCFQAYGCTGNILVDECRFDRAHDDAINIYNYLLHIEKKESPRTLLLRFPSVEQCGFNVFFPGEQIGYRHHEELLLKGTNVVVSSELVDKMTIRLTVRDDLPEDMSMFHIENLARIPAKTVIRNNYFGCFATRAILMNTSRKTLIEGNTFHRIPMSTILAKTPDGNYWLQNYIDGLMIRNNTFIECHGYENAKFTPGSGIINFNLETRTVVPDQFPHRNVDIVGNRFVNEQVDATAVRVRGVKGLRIKDNTFERAGRPTHLATVFGCADVQLDGNRISGQEGKASILYGQMEPEEIKATPDTQWILEAK